MPETYVLQHEQIHFAIAALEAQNLNAAAPALGAEMHAEGDSQDEVKRAIQAKLDDVIRDALDRLIERNGKFDGFPVSFSSIRTATFLEKLHALEEFCLPVRAGCSPVAK